MWNPPYSEAQTDAISHVGDRVEPRGAEGAVGRAGNDSAGSAGPPDWPPWLGGGSA